LFHIEADGKVAGFCGGFAPQKIGDGSSSGMLQFAFSEAVKGILKKPWLIFHPEVREQYPFIYKNIRKKLYRTQPAVTVPAQVFKPIVGLVVIGVLPAYRGKGMAQLLMEEFEKNAARLQRNELLLSVKKDNARAIKAYEKFGWQINDTHAKTYVLGKLIK